jgi:hypothetical protein
MKLENKNDTSRCSTVLSLARAMVLWVYTHEKLPSAHIIFVQCTMYKLFLNLKEKK